MLKLLKLFLWCIFLSLCGQSYSDFQIVEVFPNTVDDKNLEYIIVENTSSETLSLSGFTLSDKSKDYFITTDEILESWEQQKFLRSETKLILNNSNEDVFLRDSEWEIIDEVSYEKTTKWDAISFEVAEIISDIPNILISDEVYISWEIIISDEVVLEPVVGEIIDVPEDLDNVSEELTPQAPEVLIWLQRPSYISLSRTLNTYTCDTSKDECKVNFDLRDSFSDDFPERDYVCEIDFWVSWVIFWEEEKCNPNTVIFPEWEYEIVFKIYHEDHETVFSEKNIFIENINPEESVEIQNLSLIISTEEEEDTSNSSSSSASISVQQEILTPEISFSLQRPSYITESNEEDIFYCDLDQDECKVNFDLRESFSDEFPERDYVCKIDFWVDGTLFWEEEKCNPNTVIFPKWSFEVTFNLYHEDYPENLTLKKIEIHNLIASISLPSSLSTSSSESSSAQPRISVWSSNFIVQSGLEWEWFNYYCVKDSCKINLKYTPKYSDEECFWNFSSGTYSHPKTLHKCNPSYVELPEWVHELSLKVYDSNYEDNFIIFPFTVYPKSYNSEENPTSDKTETHDVLENNTETWENWEVILWEVENLEIQLQWKISQNKILSWSTLQCFWVEKCSVNLLGIIQWDTKNIAYSWKHNGEIFSEKLNPAGIWVEWIWMHEITFSAGDMRETFYVDISLDTSLPLKEEWVMTEDGVYEENQNIKFTQNFLPLKYDGLRISGKAPVWSIVQVYVADTKIWESLADEKWKYRIVTKNFLAGEYVFDTKIISSSGEETFLESSWEFTLLAEERIYWFVAKSKSSSSSSSSSYTKVLPKLVLKQAEIYVPEEIQALSLRSKLWIIFTLLFLCVSMILHMISKLTSAISREIFCKT